jgi:hypothetical protein
MARLADYAERATSYRIGDQQHTIIGGRIWMDRQWGDWTGAGYAWDWFYLRFDFK